jgi:hypothetical protein
MIRKPGKDDYTQLKAYPSIALLCCMGEVAKTVVAERLLDEAERRGLLREGPFGGRREQSAINAASIMVDRAHATWKIGHRTAMLLMDIKAAFPTVANGWLVNLMKVRQMDGDLKEWTEGVLSE